MSSIFFSKNRINSIIKEIKSDIENKKNAEESKSFEDAPEFGTKEIKSGTIDRKDVILFSVEDYRMKGGMLGQKYLIHIMNPNRGGTYFNISDLAMLDKFEKEFIGVCNKLREEIVKFEKEEKEYFKKKFNLKD